MKIKTLACNTNEKETRRKKSDKHFALKKVKIKETIIGYNVVMFGQTKWLVPLCIVDQSVLKKKASNIDSISAQNWIDHSDWANERTKQKQSKAENMKYKTNYINRMTSRGKKEKKSYWTNTKPSFFVHLNFKSKKTNKQINLIELKRYIYINNELRK